MLQPLLVFLRVLKILNNPYFDEIVFDIFDGDINTTINDTTPGTDLESIIITIPLSGSVVRTEFVFDQQCDFREGKHRHTQALQDTVAANQLQLTNSKIAKQSSNR